MRMKKLGIARKTLAASLSLSCVFLEIITRVAFPLETQAASYKSTPQASGVTLKALRKFGKITLKFPEICGVGGV